MSPPAPDYTCSHCGAAHTSRNALFRHLSEKCDPTAPSGPATERVALCLAYVGADFYGCGKTSDESEAARPTVEGTVLAAAARAWGEGAVQSSSGFACNTERLANASENVLVLLVRRGERCDTMLLLRELPASIRLIAPCWRAPSGSAGKAMEKLGRHGVRRVTIDVAIPYSALLSHSDALVADAEEEEELVGPSGVGGEAGGGCGSTVAGGGCGGSDGLPFGAWLSCLPQCSIEQLHQLVCAALDPSDDGTRLLDDCFDAPRRPDIGVAEAGAEAEAGVAKPERATEEQEEVEEAEAQPAQQPQEEEHREEERTGAPPPRPPPSQPPPDTTGAKAAQPQGVPFVNASVWREVKQAHLTPDEMVDCGLVDHDFFLSHMCRDAR